MRKSPTAKSGPKLSKSKPYEERLKGWNEIARFLGQPVAVALRWARSGMPVNREGKIHLCLSTGVEPVPRSGGWPERTCPHCDGKDGFIC